MGFARSNASYRVYSCPNCGKHHCTHKTTNFWIYVGPPIQSCSKCQSEFRVDSAQEWELLTSDERSRYKQQVGFETFLRLFGAGVFAVIIGAGVGFLSERLKIGKLEKVFLPTFLTCLALFVLLAIYRIYQAVANIQASKKRTQDEAYRARAAQLKPWFT